MRAAHVAGAGCAGGARGGGRERALRAVDEECVKPLTPLEYVVGYWQSERLRDLCRLFAFDALLKLGADAGL